MSNWRKDAVVFVPEADAVGMIAVIRSLGRVGYRVHACSQHASALGLQSRYASQSVTSPAYDDPKFYPWLDAYLERHAIVAIVPSEGFLLAVRSRFERYVSLMPIAKDPAIVYRALSKVDVDDAFARAPPESRLTRNLPPSIVVRSNEKLPDVQELRKLGTPLFLKTDACHSRSGANPRVERFDEATVARDRVAGVLEEFNAVLVQGWAEGRKAAHSFCLHQEEIIAESGALGIHTNPHRGGMMSLRRSFHHAGIREDALRRIRHLGWDGAVMMEYKWEAKEDRFHLIEMNPRYWGFLHLDLFSGVDYPRIQIDRFLNGTKEPIPEQRLGVVCRHTVPGEVGYVLSKLKDRRVSGLAKIGAVLGFFARFFNLFQRSDLLFPGDRRLYWLQWWQYLRSSRERRFATKR